MAISFSGSDKQAYVIIISQIEIRHQIDFALWAFDNITKKGEGKDVRTFSSIHSFLSHAANISKMLWSPKPQKIDGQIERNIKLALGKDLADFVRGIPKLPLLKDRKLRNIFDHYDVQIVKWVEEEYPKHESGDPNRRQISDLTIGSIEEAKVGNRLVLRNYDPKTKIFTHAGQAWNLEDLRKEIISLQTYIGSVSWVN